MADIIKSKNNIPVRFVDMGDGTYAEVGSANNFSSGANFTLTGKSLTSTGASVSTLIPFDPVTYKAASCVRVSVTAPGYIRIKNSEASATSSDVLVTTKESVLINTKDKQFVSFISVSGTAIANIQAVSNSNFDLVQPSFDLNFAANSYFTNSTSVKLSDVLTFTRASQASYINLNGQMTVAAINEPRIDYDPVSLSAIGLLFEEQRTNILLNSETLSTQSVTVTNVAHTISFYGTGTATLSGAHVATVTGSGVFPTKTTLTFTPTAGTLTVTVTGTVQYANLSIGSFDTSWIPTTSAAATRLADSAVISSTAFSGFYSGAFGTVLCESKLLNLTAANRAAFDINDGSTNNRIVYRAATTGANDQLLVRSSSTSVATIASVAAYTTALTKIAIAYQLNDFSLVRAGATPVTDTSGATPTAINQISIGSAQGGAENLNGHIKRLTYIPRRVSNTEIVALTS